MDSDGAGFAHGGEFKWYGIRNKHEVPFFYRNIFGKSTVSARTVIIVMLTLRVFTDLTSLALPAGDKGKNSGPFTQERLVRGIYN
jgi:hypothetical protein